MHPLIGKISNEIKRFGPVTFARFMELSLHDPELGYYNRQPEIGRKGDFMTSVSVGPAFGKILAWAAGRLLLQREKATLEHWQFMEIGAHQGRFCRDFLDEMARFSPRLHASLKYIIAEPSPMHRDWQRAALVEHPDKVKWINDLAELPDRSLCGIIFSNELLDSFPVHVLVWQAAQNCWMEKRVGWNGSGLEWIPGKISDPGLIPPIPESFWKSLPDQMCWEISPLSLDWWSRAANKLNSGHLLTFDYGYLEEDRLAAGKTAQTIRGYFKHRPSLDLLEQPGNQDLTADVNFTRLTQAGEKAGLITESLTTQSRWLSRELLEAIKVPACAVALGPLTSQIRTLSHPGQMGEAFKVLHQKTPRPVQL